MSDIDYRSNFFPVFIGKQPYERRINYEGKNFQEMEIEALKHSVINAIEFLEGLGNQKTTIQYCINKAMKLRGTETPQWVTIDKLMKPTLIELKKNLLSRIEIELILRIDPDPED